MLDETSRNFEREVKSRRLLDISVGESSSKDIFNAIYNDISETFGIDIAIQFYQTYKGMQISFPTRLFNPDYVKNQVPIEYDGKNIKELAKKYGYSEKTIRRMVKESI